MKLFKNVINEVTKNTPTKKMKRSNSAFIELVFGNKFEAICIAFTLSTLLDLVLCVINGIYSTTFEHLLNRLIICTLIMYSLNLFRLFDKLPTFVMMAIHMIICFGIMLIVVTISGLFSPLSADAYPGAVRTVFYFYPMFIAVNMIYDLIRTAKVNRMLQKKHKNP